MISFAPKSEKEIQESALAPAGEYDFDIINAENTISSNDNPMIKVEIGLYIGSEVKNHVFDYLLPAMEAKLRHFCDTTGLLARYENGGLEAADCIGRSGRVKISIEPATEKYAAKNVVKDYICRPAKPLAGTVKNVPVEDGEIPF